MMHKNIAKLGFKKGNTIRCTRVELSGKDLYTVGKEYVVEEDFLGLYVRSGPGDSELSGHLADWELVGPALDWDKPLRTKEGFEARLLGVIDANSLTHVVAIKQAGKEMPFSFTEDGRFCGKDTPSSYDLENYEPETFVYINVYEVNGDLLADGTYRSAEAADTGAIHGVKRVGRNKVKLEKGRFDD